MYIVKYSILSYYPDIYLKSNIAVGVAFQVVSQDYYSNEFFSIDNKRKLLSFDDELEDIELIEYFLEGVKGEFLEFRRDIQFFTQDYVNNFYFEEIETRNFQSMSEVKNFIEKTYKYILHLGLDNKNRLDKNTRKAYVHSFIEDKFDKVYSAKKPIIGTNEIDRITPDLYAIKDDKEYIFKFLKSSNQTMHNVRSYLFYAFENNKDLIIILEDDMVKVESYLRQTSIRNNINIQFIFEKDLPNTSFV
ncbi:hypothetical protein [Staphylococcus delphini]|uniref:hypothetical protein n=1 Tax=Staphylococcus delphini TaxID=53344 RepID=UPI001F4E870B|nr:hypothetical protein [Staphylococcus delphini]